RNHENTKVRRRTKIFFLKSWFQNEARPLVAQAFRPANVRAGSPEGLRYRNLGTPFKKKELRDLPCSSCSSWFRRESHIPQDDVIHGRGEEQGVDAVENSAVA